jgi:bacillithiol biosynthesis deacetylase BshB1
VRILAFGAHPDDVEFGCAPVLMLEARAGHPVHIAVASKGEAATAGTAEQRAEEARAAARIIGASIEFLDLGGDCHIATSPANAIALARVIRQFRPEILLAPHPGENQHPDHAAIGKLARDAARLARYGGLAALAPLPAHPVQSLYFYVITQVFVEPPQVVVDVSAVLADWQAAMQCHASQMRTRAYPELVLARSRSWGAAIGVDYAVGLWLNDPVRVASLTELRLSSRYF